MSKISLALLTLHILSFCAFLEYTIIVHQLLDMIKEPSMIVVFMVIAFHLMDMVIELWTVGSLPEEMLVGPTPKSDVGHVACLAM